jgi:DNA-binding transcriptional LysR family regulator
VLNTVAFADTYQVAKALVAYGVGVTIIDEVTARSSGHDSIRVWPLSPDARFRMSALHQDKAPLSIVSQKFIDHLRSSLREFLQ